MFQSEWITGLLLLLGTLFVGIGLLCWLWPVSFHSTTFGPAIFIYKYHIGSFSGLLPALQEITDAFDASNGIQRITRAIRIQSKNRDITNIQVLTGGMFFDDPKTVDSSELRSAVGLIIPLPVWKSGGYDVIQPTGLLKSLKLSDARIRFIPKSEFRIAHFPLILGSLSYMIGALRVYGSAAKQDFIQCAPMEIFDHAYPSFSDTAVFDRMVSYLFAQNNLDAFDIDSDMSLPRDRR